MHQLQFKFFLLDCPLAADYNTVDRYYCMHSERIAHGAYEYENIMKCQLAA
jgi:L-arabinose isomerase